MRQAIESGCCYDVTLSERGLTWRWRCDDEHEIANISKQGGVDNLTARLLAGRGVPADDVDNFLQPKLRDFLPNPSTLKDMDKAAEHIVSAMQSGKSITVFADYDVDGGSSAAQLIRWARSFQVDFSLYVPDRVKEGYGPSAEAFRQLKQEGNELIITVDCGAAAHDALEVAADIGLPVVVIDHHMMHGDLPPSTALVNPNRDDDSSGLGHLAAAGVTFVLLVALNREARKHGLGDGPNLLEFLGLSALGTICDVVPLTGLNRAIVSQGLKVLSSTNHVGVKALSDVAGAEPPYTTYHGGFILGPRINAGGRIGKASMGAELLSTENTQLAYAHAAELDRVNQDRKQLQSQMLEEALIKAAKLPEDHAITLVSMDGWHPGVIGIVAGRLKDRFERPAIVIGVNEQGLGKGSGRSMHGVNLGEAITQAREAGLLISGGGHPMAGGLTVDSKNIEALNDFLNETLRSQVQNARKTMSLKIDAAIKPSAATTQLIETMKKVGPYGAGHPQPRFILPDMMITYAERVRGGHVRCSFADDDGQRISGICFSADETGLDAILLAPNPPRVHVAGRIKEDKWKDRVRIDLIVEDLAVTRQ